MYTRLFLGSLRVFSFYTHARLVCFLFLGAVSGFLFIVINCGGVTYFFDPFVELAHSPAGDVSGVEKSI